MTMESQAFLPNTEVPCEILMMPKKVVAVYFLMAKGQVMYVGKTTNLLQRTWQHEQYKEFDEVRFVRCTEEDIDLTEKAFIALYDPPWKSQTNMRRSGPER
jgi:hypothetical protein